MEDRKYRVNGLVIDTARYRVSGEAGVVPLEPKVFDLLVFLIRHRDRVLTRDEIFEAVWDGRAVSDATLSNHIKSARKALGDDGERQQTIQTIRSRGYQFIAAVTEETPKAAAESHAAVQHVPPDLPAPPASPERPMPDARRRALQWTVVGVLMAVALLGWMIGGHSAAPPGSARPYLLVVPFSVSANASQDHQTFADQLTREVINNLRKISGIRVVPQASAFEFRKNKAPAHVEELLPGVQYVLDGEVSVAPDGALRITPRLGDLRSDMDSWSKPFSVHVDNANFFETAADIALAVAVALKVEILKDEQRALAEYPSNPKAYEPYAAGWHEMELFTHESVRRAVTLFDRAIELDPGFNPAYLARSEALRSIFAYYEPPRAMLPEVTASLDAVLKRNPDSAQALSSLGLTQVMAWQWQEAWQNLSKARALDPSLALTELGFALYYSAIGEGQKVKDSLARANALDPLNTELADWGNWALFMVGERQAALEWGRRQMRQHPDNGVVFCGSGVSAYLRGDTEESVALLEKGVRLADRAPVALIMLAQGYGYAGRKDKVMPLLEEADRAGLYMCPYETAAAYLSLGDAAGRSRAMALLHDAVAKRSNCLIFVRNDPRMDVLRKDPRYRESFAQLLVAVGLDDAAIRSYRR